jgi:hypothetical protein
MMKILCSHWTIITLFALQPCEFCEVVSLVIYVILISCTSGELNDLCTYLVPWTGTDGGWNSKDGEGVCSGDGYQSLGLKIRLTRLFHISLETCWNMLKHDETCWNHQASEFHAVNRSSTIFQMTPRWSDFVTCWCDRSGDQFHDLFLMKNLSLGEVPMGSYGSIKLL